ncbi:MAG TPA: hypothetical protein VHA75_11525 [Rugosimonospora sp.]|nr:hypothetical protein [Rugosimonospora sp.]
MDQPVGWVVLDPAGNVVQSGPVTDLEMVSGLGEPQDTEEASDGGD